VIMEKAGFLPKNPFPQVDPIQNLPSRPPILCAGCLHRGAFYAIKKVFKDAIYPSDIGCYTLGLQLGVVDTTICMGASITVASGISHAGDPRDIVCTIGDSTFMHTGIQGLINAVYNGANMTVVILDNRITAMTGHQPNPNTGVTAYRSMHYAAPVVSVLSRVLTRTILPAWSTSYRRQRNGRALRSSSPNRCVLYQRVVPG
jgi:indolepyruvate ferredoxin oxidoreductase alpha subunit